MHFILWFFGLIALGIAFDAIVQSQQDAARKIVDAIEEAREVQSSKFTQI